MENLRAQIEKDLATSLEGEWKIDVELTSPDGIKQTMSKNNPSAKLGGQVLYFSRGENPTTGEAIIVNLPVVTLRVTSLDRVPAPGETWYIKMPIAPQVGAVKRSFICSADRAPEHGTDIGFIRLYCQRIEGENPEPVS